MTKRNRKDDDPNAKILQALRIGYEDGYAAAIRDFESRREPTSDREREQLAEMRRIMKRRFDGEEQS